MTKKYHPIVAVVWIAFGLFLMWFSYKLSLGTLSNPGPGLMPFSIGAVLFLVSLCLLAVDLFNRRNSKQKTPEKHMQVNFKKTGMVALSLILYGLFLERLGFPLTTFLFLLFSFMVMGVRWAVALTVSILTVVITHLSFTYLEVRLPSGIFRYLGV